MNRLKKCIWSQKKECEKEWLIFKVLVEDSLKAGQTIRKKNTFNK